MPARTHLNTASRVVFTCPGFADGRVWYLSIRFQAGDFGRLSSLPGR